MVLKAGQQFGPVWPSLGTDGKLFTVERVAQKTRNGSDNQRFKDRDSGSGVFGISL